MAVDTHSYMPRVGDEEIEVVITRIRRRSKDRRWGTASATHRGEAITLVGNIASFGVGERLQATGRFEDHPVYGRQFRVGQAVELRVTDHGGAIALLKTIPHVGPSRARALLERYPVETIFETIDADPVAAFSAVDGIGARHALEAAAGWQARSANRELIALLGPLELGHLVGEIERHFGSQATEVVNAHPYRLTAVAGIGFDRADAIARRVGIADASGRARAGVLHLLIEAEAQGHTFLPRAELATQLAELLDDDTDVAIGLGDPSLVIDGDRVYRSSTHRAERTVAGDLRQLAREPTVITPAAVPRGESLTDQQLAAVDAAFRSRLSVLTGGPGTGKTQTTRAICELAAASGFEVALCAPSATAADALRVATGHEAGTIHRTLRWQPGQGPHFGPGRPHPADVVVLDEASMVPLRWMEHLLPALREHAHLVLVGDSDQLGPIGAGEPFHDLCQSGVCPVTRLTEVFRQRRRSADEPPFSLLVSAAHAVKRGERPRERARSDERQDFFFHRVPTAERGATDVVRIATERIPARYGLDPARDVQVLAPVHDGVLGVGPLNDRLREVINPNGERCCEGRFRVGDRLLQTANDYRNMLFNGTLCYLTDRDHETAALHLDASGETVVLPYGFTGNLRLGYSATVHKAQGAEIPAVVVICHSRHSWMLSRRLIYTAITRASRVCVIVGDDKGLAIALGRDNADRRYSALLERLQTAGDADLAAAA